MKTFLTLIAVALTFQFSAQVAINETGASPDPSAVLDISSTERGFLTPKLTQTQRIALDSSPFPQKGTLVYQTDGEAGFYYYDNGWSPLNGGTTEELRAQITMNVAPLINNLGTTSTLSSPLAPGWTFSSTDVGKMTVNHPSLVGFGATAANAEPTIIVTADYQPNGAPPLPSEYCPNAFTGDCGQTADKQYVTRVNIFSPAGSIAVPNLTAATTKLGHCPTAGSCNVGITDYQAHLYAGTNTVCPGFAAAYGIGTNAYPSSAANQTMNAGGSFDFFVYGNTVTSAGLPNAMALSVFIDWNQDGDFDDADETVISTPKKTWAQPNPAFAPAANQNVYPVNIPITAATGTTTMRVIASPYGPGAISSCISSNKGSTRDYQLKIVGGPAPVFPGQSRVCNVKPTSPYTNSFQVDCFQLNGAFVYDKINMVVKPN